MNKIARGLRRHEGRNYLPSLIPVEPCWKYAVQICARADEEQDDQEKGLEFEDAEHRRFAQDLGETSVVWCF